MSSYEEELKAEIERVTLRGSPDKKTVQKLASIIWRLEQRLAVLENEVVVDDKPAAPAPKAAAPVEAAPARKGKTISPRKGTANESNDTE